LDPACGSGSFLLGAYQYLLNYHLEYYRKHPKEAQNLFFDFYHKVSAEDFALPLRTKARILRNNIFGVDIDPQAVEITMMSLYLKLLEGERSLPSKQALLPTLTYNIRCGNSLIGYDIFDSPSPSPARGEGTIFISPPLTGGDEGEGELRSRINPFDWKSKTAGFGDIIEGGGFDAVIGNPPYVRQEMLGEFKPYFQEHYKTFHGVADLYVYFIEKGVSLLRDGGRFSFIVANKWMKANYGEPLRRWMKGQRIEEIVDFGDLPVFQEATTYPCILRISGGRGTARRAPMISVTKVKTLDFVGAIHELPLQAYVNEHHYEVSREALDDSGWSLSGGAEEALLAKIKAVGKPLGEYVKGNIYYGIKTGLNEAFVIDSETRSRLIAEDPKSAELIKPFLVGRDIKRYSLTDEGRYLILVPKGWTSRDSSRTTPTEAWKWFRQNYPAIANHLLPFKEKAEKRYDKGEYWWELRGCDYYEEFERPKIIYAEIAAKGQFTLDSEGFYSDTTTYILGDDPKYLLGDNVQDIVY
jgi:hypothetical protein